MSKIIVIEGPDRVGKATQVDLLKNFLLSKKFVVATVEVPLKSNFMYSVIYWMLENGWAKKWPTLFQWCQYFNKQLFQWKILPKLNEHCDYIIMDRWRLSSVIYGEAMDVSTRFLRNLYDRLKKPDFTLVLLGDSHTFVSEDTYESDDVLQKRVRQGYRQWTEQNFEPSCIVSCNDTKSNVLKNIVECLTQAKVIQGEKNEL